MGKLSVYLVAVALAVILDESFAYTGRYKNWEQFDGKLVGFGSAKCSALAGILPDPQSGCCGKHSGNGAGGADTGAGNDNGQDTGAGNDNGQDTGAGNDNGIDVGGNDNGGDNDDDQGNDWGNGIGGGHGNDNGDDNDDDRDVDWENGIDGDDDDQDQEWDGGFGNDIDDADDDYGGGIFDGLDVGGWFNSFRDKRSVEQNDSDTAPDKYITAGKPAGLRQYPWLVRLEIRVREGFQMMAVGCGGSLISPRFVLTAAHCVDVNYQSYNDIRIILAEYDTRSFPRDCVGSSCVKNIVMNPDKVIKHRRYDRSHLYNDIALMRLRGSAPYSDYIRPICLPPFNVDSPNNEGATLFIAGWGSTGRQASPIKLTAQVQLVPNQKCRRTYGDLTTGQVCASGRGGQDTCQGDSGGPLMVEYKGNHYVVGIVSGKSAQYQCGSSFPSLYTNVFAYTKWIQQNMGNQ